MASKIISSYNNPYAYNRDSSVDSKYVYINDLSIYKPIYGSNVSFVSRLGAIQTINNSLKILPISENNISVKYNLRFLLTDNEAGNLLKTIETAGGYNFLKFKDPSNIYKEICGFVEDYSIRREAKNLNLFNVDLFSYSGSPILNWRTSSFLKDVSSSNTVFRNDVGYKKYSFVYYEHSGSDEYNKHVSKNKIDNFWFAKNNLAPGEFSTTNWTKNFIYEDVNPFELKNKLDFSQLAYKNSYIENSKTKTNANSLNDFTLDYENIDDDQCKSMLFFLEKKCGYRKFIYGYPVFLKKNKVFICTEWQHSFIYKNNNKISVKFTEDPNPNIFIENDGNSYYII